MFDKKRPVVYGPETKPGVGHYPLLEVMRAEDEDELDGVWLDCEYYANGGQACSFSEDAVAWLTARDAAAILLAYQKGELVYRKEFADELEEGG